MTLRKGSRLCCDQSLISAEVVSPLDELSLVRLSVGSSWVLPEPGLLGLRGWDYIYIYLYISFWQLHLLRPFCTSTVSVIF